MLTSLFSDRVTAGAVLLSSSEIVTVYWVIEPKLLPDTDDNSTVKLSLPSSSLSLIISILIVFSLASPSAHSTVPEADSTSSPTVAVPELNKYEADTAPIELPWRASVMSILPWFQLLWFQH